MSADKVNLLDYDQSALADFFAEIGEKSYRATQVLKWIHQAGVTDFNAMSNLSNALRQRLSVLAEIAVPQIVTTPQSVDGTQKWLLQLDCGNRIETVFIPEGDRGTLCVSSQVGCALQCSFCVTGRQGFNRNLTTAEIIGQVWLVARSLSQQGGGHDRHITNVVMMGMGEPLLNFTNVVKAMAIMMDDNAYGLSKYRVTLSTAGIVPALEKLRQVSPVSLAVSLHAPNDALRDTLVPLNKKYPIKQLMALCRHYFSHEPRRKVTFEYVMLAGVNDKLAHAQELIQILQGVPAKVNLIPFNEFEGVSYRCSTDEQINQFRELLMVAGVQTMIRKTRGYDIDAACGLLAGKVHSRSRRQHTGQVAA